MMRTVTGRHIIFLASLIRKESGRVAMVTSNTSQASHHLLSMSLRMTELTELSEDVVMVSG